MAGLGHIFLMNAGPLYPSAEPPRAQPGGETRPIRLFQRPKRQPSGNAGGLPPPPPAAPTGRRHAGPGAPAHYQPPRRFAPSPSRQAHGGMIELRRRASAAFESTSKGCKIDEYLALKDLSGGTIDPKSPNIPALFLAHRRPRKRPLLARDRIWLSRPAPRPPDLDNRPLDRRRQKTLNPRPAGSVCPGYNGAFPLRFFKRVRPSRSTTTKPVPIAEFLLMNSRRAAVRSTVAAYGVIPCGPTAADGPLDIRSCMRAFVGGGHPTAAGASGVGLHLPSSKSPTRSENI